MQDIQQVQKKYFRIPSPLGVASREICSIHEVATVTNTLFKYILLQFDVFRDIFDA